MTSSKQIKFEFIIDTASANKVKTVLQELTKEAEKLSAAMQGAGGAFKGGRGGGNNRGGSGGGPTSGGGSNSGGVAGGSNAGDTLAQVVISNSKALKDLSKISSDSMRGVTQAISQGVEDQKTKIRSLKQEIDSLATSYSKLSGADKDQAGKDLIQRTGDLNKAQTDLNNMPGGTPPPGFMSQANGWLAKAGKGMRAVAAPVGLAINGAMAIGEELGTGGAGGMEVRTEARRGDLLNARIRALRGGDISQLMLQHHIMQDPTKRAYYETATNAMAQVKAYGAGSLQALVKGGGPAAGMLAGMLGIDMSSAQGQSALEGLTEGEIQNKLLKYSQGIEGEAGRSTGFLDKQMAFEHLQQTLAARTSAQQVMGLNLKGRIVKGADGQDHTVGQYGSMATRLMNQGLDPNANVNNFASLRMMGGAAFGGRLSEYETNAQAGGYSGFGSMAARALRGARSPEEALRLARGALGGGIEKGAGIGLGNLVYGYDPRGTTSNEALMTAIQSGFDWKKMSPGSQFNTVEALGGALKGMDQISTGSLDNATLGSSTLAASKILGSGANTGAVDYLATMGFKQLMEAGYGKPTGALAKGMEAYGVTSTNAQDEMKEKIKNLFASQTTYTGPIGDLARAVVNSDDPFKVVKENKFSGVALSERTKMGGEEGEAAAALYGAIGGKKGLKLGDVGANKLTDVNRASAEQQANEFARQETNLKDQGTVIEAMLDASKKIAEFQKNFGTNLESSAGTLITSMNVITDAIIANTKRMNGEAGAKATGKITLNGQSVQIKPSVMKMTETKVP